MITNRDKKSFGLHIAEKIPEIADTIGTVDVQEFWDHFEESFRMSKSSWMMDPTRSCEMPSCSAIDLVEIRMSSKMKSWI